MTNSTNPFTAPYGNINPFLPPLSLLPLPTPSSHRQTLSAIDNISSATTDNDLQQVPPFTQPSSTFGMPLFLFFLIIVLTLQHSRKHSHRSSSSTVTYGSECRTIELHAIVAWLSPGQIRSNNRRSTSNDHTLLSESVSWWYSTRTYRRFLTHHTFSFTSLLSFQLNCYLCCEDLASVTSNGQRMMVSVTTCLVSSSFLSSSRI